MFRSISRITLYVAVFLVFLLAHKTQYSQEMVVQPTVDLRALRDTSVRVVLNYGKYKCPDKDCGEEHESNVELSGTLIGRRPVDDYFEYFVSTASHFKSSSSTFKKMFVEVFRGGKLVHRYPADILLKGSYGPKGNDSALLRFTAYEDFPRAKMAKRDCEMNVGDRVFLFGCPGGEAPQILDRDTTIVSREPCKKSNSDIIINSRTAMGRSGGGLFNQDGEWIGSLSVSWDFKDQAGVTSWRQFAELVKNTNWQFLVSESPQ